VKPHRKDTYAVVTGGRRLAALQLLAKVNFWGIR